MAKEKQSIDDFVKTIKETGKMKDLQIEQFLEQNATFKKNDQIVLVLPVTKQVTRLTVTDVSAAQNNLTGKMDIAYTFNDGSMLFHSSLEKDGYDWQYAKTMEAEELVWDVQHKERTEEPEPAS